MCLVYFTLHMKVILDFIFPISKSNFEIIHQKIWGPWVHSWCALWLVWPCAHLLSLVRHEEDMSMVSQRSIIVRDKEGIWYRGGKQGTWKLATMQSPSVLKNPMNKPISFHSNNLGFVAKFAKFECLMYMQMNPMVEVYIYLEMLENKIEVTSIIALYKVKTY